MEKLIVLGTGNASVTKCYNTCSIIQDKKSKNRIIRINTGILSNMKQKIKEFYH